MSHLSIRNPLVVYVTLAGLVALTWHIYTNALPGYFLFDDHPNLLFLSTVSDPFSALAFISSGEAGPLGRPLALTTFALQAESWPDDPASFLRLNFVLHIAAMLAVFVLATALARVRAPKQALFVGLFVAAMWGLNPFLATTNLMIVQRMTSLAAIFVFSGLAAFTWAHLLSNSRPFLSRVLLLFSLGLATLFAVASKEIGALLPLLALIVLYAWIPVELRLRTRIDLFVIAVLAIIPAALLLAYLVSHFSFSGDPMPGRSFTMMERLLAQPGVLLDYVQNLLMPRALYTTPFTDSFPHAASTFGSFPASLNSFVWVVFLGFAFALRRQIPAFFFGLTFFFAGHVLESSFLNLEMYFAHRNYVPAFGLFFAISFSLFSAVSKLTRILVIGAVSYSSLFALVLLQATSAWGNPLVTAEQWFSLTPRSERAAQFLANQYLAIGDKDTAARVIRKAAEFDSRSRPMLLIQTTKHCDGTREEFEAAVDAIVEILSEASLQFSAAVELSQAAQMPPPATCEFRDLHAVGRMTDALLSNPAYVGSRRAHSLLLFAKGFVEADRGNVSAAKTLLVEAFRRSGELEMAFYAASYILAVEEEGEARAFLAEVKDAAPEGIIPGRWWLRRIGEFEDSAVPERQSRQKLGTPTFLERPEPLR